MSLDKKLHCLICNSDTVTDYYYPPNRFNEKLFSYFLCRKCHSAFIHPCPTTEDFNLIYGTEDHSYLKRLKEDEKLKFNYDLPEYNHQRYQLEFFDKFAYHNSGKTLLDIGCGSGFYMNYARSKGLETAGVEYNSEFAELLRKKTDLKIYSFSEFESMYLGKTFDLIHAGHILEHLVDPHSIFDFIKRFSNDRTILIVDGPLENNFCLSRFIIKLGSRIRNKKENNYPPQHITFTNYDSQLLFFEKNGLKKLNYRIAEQLHPLPEKPDRNSRWNTLLYFLGLISVNFSLLNRRWGNIFHYAGKFEK